MTTITPPMGGELPVPPDADVQDLDAFDEENVRVLWSRPEPMPDSLGADQVRLGVCQRRDGTIVTEGTDGPAVYHGGHDYTVAEAIALASAILRVACLAERWVRWQPGDVSDPARADVIVITQDVDDRLELVCRPFEPHASDYDGEMSLSVYYRGGLESDFVLDRAQSAQLASLLVGDHR